MAAGWRSRGPAMRPLPVTTLTAALLALIYVVLAALVIRGRMRERTGLGAGHSAVAMGQEHTAPLLVAIRAHANFGEYVPLALILMGLAEMGRSPRPLLLGVGAMLVVGRLLHPYGLARPAPNPYRALGAVLTIAAILLLAAGLLAQLANDGYVGV